MVKPIKTAGKSQKQQIALAQRKKNKSGPELKEIKKKSVDSPKKKAIPKSTFKKLVMEITSNIVAEQSNTIGKRSTRNSQRILSSTTNAAKSPQKKTPIKKEIKIKKETKVKKEIKSK